MLRMAYVQTLTSYRRFIYVDLGIIPGTFGVYAML